MELLIEMTNDIYDKFSELKDTGRRTKYHYIFSSFLICNFIYFKNYFS